jgi:hypothetical protein
MARKKGSLGRYADSDRRLFALANAAWWSLYATFGRHCPTRRVLINTVITMCWRETGCDRQGRITGKWDSAACEALDLPPDLGTNPAALRHRLSDRIEEAITAAKEKPSVEDAIAAAKNEKPAAITKNRLLRMEQASYLDWHYREFRRREREVRAALATE